METRLSTDLDLDLDLDMDLDLDLDLEYDLSLLPPPLLSSAIGRDLSSGDLDLDRDLDTDLEYDLSLLVVVSALLSPSLSPPLLSRSPSRSLPAGGGDLDLSLPPRSLLCGGGASHSLLAFPPSSTGPGPACCCLPALSSCRRQCPPSS